ncbi:MAG: Hsp33 family molecular chaperone HslO [Gammaproteobacteria bacterium]
MARGDSLRRFFFEAFPVRGELVHLDAAWQAVLERHDYPPAVRALLGEAMAASVLLASTLKFEGMLTLQLQGEGDLYLLVAQCGSDLSVRGLAKWRSDDPRGTLAELTGAGRLAITIESRKSRERYQGIVSADTDDLSGCLENYFANSEQLPTRLWLAADADRAAGMLLQRLPEAEGRAAEDEGWNRTGLLADTITRDELLNVGDRDVLRRLFHEEDLRLVESEAVAFSCSCNRGRVESALRLIGRDELEGLLAEEGTIQVRCEFCNMAYELDPVDVERLLSGGGDDVPPPVSQTLH